MGSYNRNTWGAYLLNGELFIKRSEAIAEPAAYPDFGCTFEMFTNQDFLELETLGPMGTLAPGAAADVSLFRLVQGEWAFRDSSGVEESGGTRLEPVAVIRAGHLLHCTPNHLEAQ